MSHVSSYIWYIRHSPAWQEKRRAALERAGFRCERGCGRRATQVHHLTYVRLFDETPFDLVALCAQCHAAIHHKTPANNNQLPLPITYTDTA